MLFGLVVVRMAGLVRQQERSLDARADASAAPAPRSSGRPAATEIDGVAVDSARSLAGAGRRRAIGAGAASVGSATSRVELARRPGERSTRALAAAASRRSPCAATRRRWLRRAVHTRVRVAPHGGAAPRARRRRRAGSRRPSQAALRALATQVALALDSAALTEEVHRRRSEARFGSLVQHSSDLITVLGPDGEIAYQSPSIERVLGYTPEEVIGPPLRRPRRRRRPRPARPARRLRGRRRRRAAQAIECALVHRDGGTRQFEILMTNLLDDEHVGGIVLNSRDVSERKAFEEQLAHQAFHDGVTGLANRALFAERVRHALARSRREERGLAVIFLDLDDFKTINDSLGHAAGDEVLVGGRRAGSTQSIRGADTAARFGGDEFAVLLEDVEDSQEAADAAERILEALADAAVRRPQGARAARQPRHLGRRARRRRPRPTR